jgi:hypothetical protein
MAAVEEEAVQWVMAAVEGSVKEEAGVLVDRVLVDGRAMVGRVVVVM